MCLPNVIGILIIVLIIATGLYFATKYKIIKELMQGFALAMAIVGIVILCTWLLTYQC